MPHQKSRVLLLSTRSWPVIAPLVDAFDRAGFAVALALGHAVAKPPPSVARLYPARPPQLRPTIEFAIRDWAPDLVVPADAAAFGHLAALHEGEAGSGGGGGPIGQIIARSLGDPQGLRRLTSARTLQQFARDHELPVPNSVEVGDESGLRALLTSVPLPVMLKGAGGAGRRAEAVRSVEAGIAAYRRLAGGRARRWLTRGLPWALAGRSCRGGVAVQQYVDGVAAKRLVAARDGRVLAGISIEPLDGAGPAMVAKFIRHAAMADIAAAIVRPFGLSGLLGVDFVLEHGSRRAWLVGVKPYAGPVAHLVAAGEAGLAAALHEAFAGRPRRLPARSGELVTIGARSGG